MMKLKYLIYNHGLAKTLAEGWEYDEGSEELFQYFRISANAIYPLRIKGEICYLRFSPTFEKREGNLKAELAFLDYLREHGYPVMEAVRSQSGDQMVRKKTPWGEYYASVFKQVPGKQISQTDYDDGILYAYGAALGELHSLSRKFENPLAKRWTHTDIFEWIGMTLDELRMDQKPFKELAIIKNQFTQLPINQDNYGLIHFDFEPDNVFYDETSQRCSVIDFDDSMYHWYVMDIVQALEASRDEIGTEDSSLQEEVFLDGYRSVYIIDEDVFKQVPLFRRFAKLYQFTRVTRAIEERFDDEPDWMVGLRERLESLLMEIRLDFGE
jgi:Ser/Thr protein kinase RdoA (MazF antagonist)